jgi:hypothetical protein
MSSKNKFSLLITLPNEKKVKWSGREREREREVPELARRLAAEFEQPPPPSSSSYSLSTADGTFFTKFSAISADSRGVYPVVVCVREGREGKEGREGESGGKRRKKRRESGAQTGSAVSTTGSTAEREREGVLSFSAIANDRENELIVARDDLRDDADPTDAEMRLFVHAANFRRMRRAASPTEYVPVVSFVGPTGAGKSTLIRSLSPVKAPVIAFDEQQIPTTSNVNSFESSGFGGLGRVRLLDLEGDDGGLPLMEYLKNFRPEAGVEGLTQDDVNSFVKQVFAEYDSAELGKYMEKRKRVTKILLPRLCYILSDVVVYVNTVPAKRESEYLERVQEFVQRSQAGVASAEAPSLILVRNVCPRRAKPFGVAEATEDFFTFIDRERKLTESYRSVDFVKIPDNEYDGLYDEQINTFRSTLASRIKESAVVRRTNGTFFSERVWMDVLEACVNLFGSSEGMADEGPLISMSSVFGRFILSESDLVNSSYAFFDAVYGPPSGASTDRFQAAREGAARALAVAIVVRSAEKGHVILSESLAAAQEQLVDLLARIDRRAPCAAKAGGVQCTGERSTHGERHRFGVFRRRGSFEEVDGADAAVEAAKGAFADALRECVGSTKVAGEEPATPDASASGRRRKAHRRRGTGDDSSSTSTSGTVKELTADVRTMSIADLATKSGLDKDDLRALGRFRVALHTSLFDYAKASAGPTPTPSSACALCFASGVYAGLELLGCGHALCSWCCGALQGQRWAVKRGQRERFALPYAVASLTADRFSEQSLASNERQCPLCGTCSPIVQGAPTLPRRHGVRILCLEGGGLRGQILGEIAKVLEKGSGVRLTDMFDIICGTGCGGALALLLGSGACTVDASISTFDKLERAVFAKVRPGATLRKRAARMAGIPALGRAPYSSSMLSTSLAAILGSRAHLGAGSRVVPTSAIGTQAVRGVPSPPAFALAGSLVPRLDPLLLTNYAPGQRDKPRVDPLLPLSEAVRACFSAPKWTAPGVGHDGSPLIDGAVYTNNPAEMAVTEANTLYNFPDIDCVITIGTGLVGSAASASSSGSRGTVTGDAAFPFDKEVVDLRESCRNVNENMSQVLGDSKYVRLEPTLPNPTCDTVDEEARLDAIRGAQNWLRSREGKSDLDRATSLLRAKSVYVDGAGSIRATVGAEASFVIRGKKGVEAAELKKMRFEVNVKATGSRAKAVPVSVGRVVRSGGISVTFTLPSRGAYNVSVVMASENGQDISGSPFVLLGVTGAEDVGPTGWPARFAGELAVSSSGSDFPGKRTPGADFDPDSSDLAYVLDYCEWTREKELGLDGTFAKDRHAAATLVLRERMADLGLRESSASPVPEATVGAVIGSLWTAAAAQMYGKEETTARAPFVRSMAAWWLRLNPTFRLRDGRTLVELVGGAAWERYVDAIDDGSAYGDAVALVAISEVFGVRVVLVTTAASSDNYVVEVNPNVFKLEKSVILGLVGNYGFCGLRMSRKSTLFTNRGGAADGSE